MFGKKAKEVENPIRVETIIGKGTNITGDLYSQGSLRIEGRLEGGKVAAMGDIFIGQEGYVVANITGRNVVIAGKVHGDVDAKEKLEIVPTGVLIGDIKMATLVIEDGASFKGKSESRKHEGGVTSVSAAVAASQEKRDKAQESK